MKSLEPQPNKASAIAVYSEFLNVSERSDFDAAYADPWGADGSQTPHGDLHAAKLSQWGRDARIGSPSMALQSTPRTQERRAAPAARPEKLESISRKLQDFEKHLTSDAHSRMASETWRMQTIQDLVTKLASDVDKENRDRLDAHKSLSTTLQQQLNIVSEKLEQFVGSKINSVVQQVSDAEQRISKSENVIANLEQSDDVQKLEQEIQKCAAELMELKNLFAAESEAYVKLINDKVSAFERSVEARFSEELILREKKLTAFQAEYETNMKERALREHKFQAHTLKHLAELRTQMEAETAMRLQGDDDIVHSLSQYTETLVGQYSPEVDD